MGADSDLVQTIDELQQLTLNIFFSGLNQTVHKILTKVRYLPDPESGPGDE